MAMLGDVIDKIEFYRNHLSALIVLFDNTRVVLEMNPNPDKDTVEHVKMMNVFTNKADCDMELLNTTMRRAHELKERLDDDNRHRVMLEIQQQLSMIEQFVDSATKKMRQLISDKKPAASSSSNMERLHQRWSTRENNCFN